MDNLLVTATQGRTSRSTLAQKAHNNMVASLMAMLLCLSSSLGLTHFLGLCMVPPLQVRGRGAVKGCGRGSVCTTSLAHTPAGHTAASNDDGRGQDHPSHLRPQLEITRQGQPEGEQGRAERGQGQQERQRQQGRGRDQGGRGAGGGPGQHHKSLSRSACRRRSGRCPASRDYQL